MILYFCSVLYLYHYRYCFTKLRSTINNISSSYVSQSLHHSIVSQSKNFGVLILGSSYPPHKHCFVVFQHGHPPKSLCSEATSSTNIYYSAYKFGIIETGYYVFEIFVINNQILLLTAACGNDPAAPNLAPSGLPSSELFCPPSAPSPSSPPRLASWPPPSPVVRSPPPLR